MAISASAAALKLPAASSWHVTNVWSGAASTSNGSFAAQVPPYSTVLLQVSPG
jgi:alpha-galactosidase